MCCSTHVDDRHLELMLFQNDYFEQILLLKFDCELSLLIHLQASLEMRSNKLYKLPWALWFIVFRVGVCMYSLKEPRIDSPEMAQSQKEREPTVHLSISFCLASAGIC